MSEPISPADLAELERLEKAASAAPWEAGHCFKTGRAVWINGRALNPFSMEQDADFIAALRNAAPRLFAALQQAWAEVGTWRAFADAITALEPHGQAETMTVEALLDKVKECRGLRDVLGRLLDAHDRLRAAGEKREWMLKDRAEEDLLAALQDARGMVKNG